MTGFSTIASNSTKIDDLTGVEINIPYEHHQVHEGEFFEYMDVIAATNGSTQTYLFTVPADTIYPHFGYYIDAVADYTLEIFKASDRVGSSLQTAYNKNHNSSNTPTMTIHKGTSGGTTDGTRFVYRKVGYASGTTRIASQAGSSQEYVLKRGDKVLVKVTNGTTAQNIGFACNWYEE